MREYDEDHHMIEWLDKIFDDQNKQLLLDPATALLQLIEQWDQDQGRAMQQAEKKLSQPIKQFQWSPQLRSAGLIYQYWKLRLRKNESNHITDYSATFNCILQQTKEHNPNFALPSLGIPY